MIRGSMVALALASAGAVFIWVRDDNGGAPGSIERVGDDTAAGALRATSGPFAAIGGFFQRVGDSWNAAAKVEKLREENQQLQLWRDQALMLAERMERYETLLKMPAESFGVGADVAGAVSARLVLDSGGPFKRTLLANAGAEHGVKRDYIVINENGLVGRVVKVGQRSTRVLMLDDFNSRVPVMGIQSRVRALLAGDASTTPTLETGALDLTPPRLDFQVPENALREGERIVTSGDGGVFPRGVLVGFAAKTRDGKWRVRLSAAAKPIDFVRIVPFATPQVPELVVQPEQPEQPGAPPPVLSFGAIAAAPLPEATIAAQKRTPAAPPPRPRIITPPEEDEGPTPAPDIAPPLPAPAPASPGRPAATPPAASPPQ
jgi:rod shape-determining protein MreC